MSVFVNAVQEVIAITEVEGVIEGVIDGVTDGVLDIDTEGVIDGVILGVGVLEGVIDKDGVGDCDIETEGVAVGDILIDGVTEGVAEGDIVIEGDTVGEGGIALIGTVNTLSHLPLLVKNKVSANSLTGNIIVDIICCGVMLKATTLPRLSVMSKGPTSSPNPVAYNVISLSAISYLLTIKNF